MTRIEIIEESIVKQRELLTAAKKEYYDFKSKVKESYIDIAKHYFDPQIVASGLEDCYIDTCNEYGDGTRIEFKRPSDGRKYDKVILEVGLNEDWNTQLFDEINTSVYSTNDNSDYELERLILVGEVSKVILDFKDDIIAQYNDVKLAHKDVLKSLSKKVREYEQYILSLQKEIKTNKFDAAKLLLEATGLEFDKEANMDVKFNQNRNGIISAKIISKTKSAKTAAISLTRKYYNGEVTTQIFDSVRMINVDYLVRQYINQL